MTDKLQKETKALMAFIRSAAGTECKPQIKHIRKCLDDYEQNLKLINSAPSDIDTFAPFTDLIELRDSNLFMLEDLTKRVLETALRSYFDRIYEACGGKRDDNQVIIS